MLIKRGICSGYLLTILLLAQPSLVFSGEENGTQYALPPFEGVAKQLNAATYRASKYSWPFLIGIRITAIEKNSVAEMLGITPGKEFIILVAGQPAAISGGRAGSTKAVGVLTSPSVTEPVHLVTVRRDNAGRKIFISYILPPGKVGISLAKGHEGLGPMPKKISYQEYGPEKSLQEAQNAEKNKEMTKALGVYAIIQKWYPLSPQARVALKRQQSIQKQQSQAGISTLINMARGGFRNEMRHRDCSSRTHTKQNLMRCQKSQALSRAMI